MELASPRFWPIFFELYEALPRQGPGNFHSAQRAYAHCTELPDAPRILDLGCGVGAQTLHLAQLCPHSALIAALDAHAPSILRLQRTVAERGLQSRIDAVVADMAQPPYPAHDFDLVWSEGALYNLGLQKGLRDCATLLRPRGYLVFTEPVWRTPNPPAAVKATFDFDYPQMGSLESALELIESSAFELLTHFSLPDEAWWDEFYTPMNQRILLLQQHYAQDAEALAVLEQLAREPETHRQFGDCYAYEFFVLRRLGAD